MTDDIRKLRLYQMLKQISPDGDLHSLAESLHAIEIDQESHEILGSDCSSANDSEFVVESLDCVVRNKGCEGLDEEQQESLEAIIHKRYRPAIYVEMDSFKQPRAPWAHLGTPEVRSRIEEVIPFVGRIELVNDPRGRPYVGTGCIVGPNIVMTNRHVAEDFLYGLGREGVVFKPGVMANIDFLQEQGSPKSRCVKIHHGRTLMVHPRWDLAILSVDGLEEYVQYRGPIESYPALMSDPEAECPGREVAVIGFPALDERNDLDLQRKIFEVFNVKRMQPGKLGNRTLYQSYGNPVSALTHDSSTLGGNSGSAVIDISTGAIVGIHFAGEYLHANFAIPASDLAKDSQIVDCGVRFRSFSNNS